MYVLSKLESTYPFKMELEVRHLHCSQKEKKGRKKRVTLKESLGSLFKATNWISIILEFEIGFFKGPKSIKT